MDETKGWISEKDTALSTDDYGRDLAGVQTLQRKHEGLERDMAALDDKVWILAWISLYILYVTYIVISTLMRFGCLIGYSSIGLRML